MHAAPVDPRDTCWEVDSPAFRVYFWQQPTPVSQASAPELAGWSLEEWRLTGPRDVNEVIAWAELHRGDRSYTLHVEVDEQGGLGLVTLAGTDPTSS
ncbi:hypothetical protein D5H78_09940 [Vallicoccus soli]|uniref:Uncharacterized protein n=1 Tax=Vallicoccus soli TaxID=2339232 RepID=A0A3A3YYK2_9ACTN|nr:hypothetical protein D5H78_09940 [Vallicoccus soli]